ncbi:MAG: phosphoribosylamine--glycine ligase [Candidatus Hydrogenedentota bacterium]|nr:MAG: phosphoribosylamine--glycine ligase [Candidatus Hydrogenedentota bacterium]
MKILVVGGGGREHTLVWKISQSALVKKLFCAPGNAGIAEQAQCVNIDATDIDGLVKFADKEKIDLSVVGPEAPLVDGIVDRFNERGLRIFGPTADAALLEGSKGFAKKLMARFNIPTGSFQIFSDADEAIEFIREMGAPIVVKADGLAAGKGVTVAFDEKSAIAAVKRCICQGAFGRAGRRVVLEEYLEGEEASVLAFTDGKSVLMMPSSQDHKAIYDGDKGPNTGGMGAYSPAPLITDELMEQIEKQILKPTIDGLREEGCEYRGVLYCGLMVDDSGPRTLEFNVRFGDPETQVVVPRLKSDIVPILLACADGELGDMKAEWSDEVAVCVVLASEGYPGKYEKGKPIEGLDKACKVPGAVVFHAGTSTRNKKVVTDGGRVLGATALAKDIPSAIKAAYRCADAIQFSSKYYRTDIGEKALLRLRNGK